MKKDATTKTTRLKMEARMMAVNRTASVGVGGGGGGVGHVMLLLSSFGKFCSQIKWPKVPHRVLFHRQLSSTLP